MNVRAVSWDRVFAPAPQDQGGKITMQPSMLLLLVVIPLAAWRYARKHTPRHTWLFVGIAVGSVISPLSLGLYSTYFLGPLGFPTGMLGLVSSIFHGLPGYQFAFP
jgi:hypothetical protein